MSLALHKAIWDRLPLYLQVPHSLSKTEALEVMTATTLAPGRKYLLIGRSASGTPLASLGYEVPSGGCFVTIGQPHEEFDTPNGPNFDRRYLSCFCILVLV